MGEHRKPLETWRQPTAAIGVSDASPNRRSPTTIWST